MRRAYGHVAAASLLTVLASACGEPAPDASPRVRAIKPYYVAEPAGGDVRRYSGTVAAANTSALSFAGNGTVATVEVVQGDRVVEGQVLATLDSAPFELNVTAARSELAAARASYESEQVNLDRQRQLLEREWIAQAAYDQASAAFDAAEGQLNLARSRLGLAERDFANASLRAPFDGVVALRNVEPFTEVAAGQTVLQVDTEDAFEVELRVPDAVISRVAMGAPVTVNAATASSCGCSGRVTEIGAQAGAGGVVPVTVAILNGGGDLLPGMTVEASVVLADGGGPGGYLVPLVAIAPGDDEARGYVFKYDVEEGVVRRTPIEGGGAASENLIGVSEGVEAGDIIAAAGVSFLRDGQRVSLMGQ